jgi:hypothetical protein
MRILEGPGSIYMNISVKHIVSNQPAMQLQSDYMQGFNYLQCCPLEISDVEHCAVSTMFIQYIEVNLTQVGLDAHR